MTSPFDGIHEFEQELLQRQESLRAATTYDNEQIEDQGTTQNAQQFGRFSSETRSLERIRPVRNVLIAGLQPTYSPNSPPVLTPQVPISITPQRNRVMQPTENREENLHTTSTTQRKKENPSDTEKRFYESMDVLLREFVRTARMPPAHASALTPPPSSTPSRREPSYNFSGRLEENPTRFMKAMDQYMAKYSIREDREKFTIVREQLGGEAREWIDGFNNTYLSFEGLKVRFDKRYNSEDRLVAANISLFSDKQGPRERVEVFLTRKRELMARLQPNLTMATAIGVLISQIRPDMGRILRANKPRTIDELIEAADCMERGEDAENAPTRKIASTGPPTPCRYCQGWHFNRECPERNNNREAGNARAVEGMARQGDPSNRREQAGPQGRGFDNRRETQPQRQTSFAERRVPPRDQYRSPPNRYERNLNNRNQEVERNYRIEEEIQEAHSASTRIERGRGIIEPTAGTSGS